MVELKCLDCVLQQTRAHREARLNEGQWLAAFDRTEDEPHPGPLPLRTVMLRAGDAISRSACALVRSGPRAALRRALADGVPFYESTNDVILTPGVRGALPPRYVERVVDLRRWGVLREVCSMRRRPKHGWGSLGDQRQHKSPEASPNLVEPHRTERVLR